jgi:hypothetical protein
MLPLSLWHCRLNFVTGNQLSTQQSLGVKVATPVGNLVGQLLFGWLADVLGRKRMCKCSFRLKPTTCTNNRYVVDGIELMIMIIATFGQALAGQAPAVSVLGVIIVWRFIVSATVFLQDLCLILLSIDGRRYRGRLPSECHYFFRIRSHTFPRPSHDCCLRCTRMGSILLVNFSPAVNIILTKPVQLLPLSVLSSSRRTKTPSSMLSSLP